MIDPERRLFVAILVQALCDFHGLASASKVEITDARQWIASNADRPGSFVNVCGLLNLDHEAVREHVQRMKPERFTARINRSLDLPITDPSLELAEVL